MGFSLGAALAATLLLRRGSQTGQAAFRSAVFLSGTLPGDWDLLEKGIMGFLQANQVKTPIQIPTVHAWDPEDPDHPGQSHGLLQMCSEKNRVQVQHGAGHGVPSREEEVGALAAAIKVMLASLD